MAYSGLVKDPNAGLGAQSTYPMRLIGCILIALGMGWGFTTYMPQIGDMAGRVGLGIAMAIILVLLTTNVSVSWGERLFGALMIGAAFATGMWGLWVQDNFGNTLPTVEQLKSSLQGKSYSFTLFGEPFTTTRYSFEIWVAITGGFIGIPVLASLAKPRDGDISRSNPFEVHPDFAQPFMSKLITLSLIAFAVAAGAVYAAPYLPQYGVPIEVALIPPFIVAFLFTKLHMTFIKAVIVSLFGGIAGAAGFWLPWHYMSFGQTETIAFVQSAPSAILSQVTAWADATPYNATFFGEGFTYGPWTFEIWAGLTLAFLCLPLLVTLVRRLAAIVRLS